MNTKTQTPTQAYIHEVESRMRSHFSSYSPILDETLDQLVLTGSKSIRPTAILLLGNMFNTERDILPNLGAAIEMMHIATQVHDNLGNHTGSQNARKMPKTRFATSASVLAGDFAFAAAAQLAAATQRIMVMQKFSETLQFIVNGKITYMFNNGDKWDQVAYYDWAHAKTASLFKLATGMAALLGTANPTEVEAATQFGYNLGMAFHLTNDVLIFTDDPSKSDGIIRSHLRQGILTLPTILFLNSDGNQMDINLIRKNNGNGQSDIDRIINQIRQSDAIDQTAREADRFLGYGLEALTVMPNTPERVELENLARKAIHRDLLE